MEKKRAGKGDREGWQQKGWHFRRVVREGLTGKGRYAPRPENDIATYA